MISKENLDKRICDVEGVSNTQTYREFIRKSEEYFEIHPVDIDKMGDEELNKYLNFLDSLWDK